MSLEGLQRCYGRARESSFCHVEALGRIEALGHSPVAHARYERHCLLQTLRQIICKHALGTFEAPLLHTFVCFESVCRRFLYGLRDETVLQGRNVPRLCLQLAV